MRNRDDDDEEEDVEDARPAKMLSKEVLPAPPNRNQQEANDR